MYIEGINPSLTHVASLDAPLPFGVGQRGRDHRGREYVFATTTAAHAAGDVVQLPVGNSGNATALTTAAALYNRQGGVVPVTFAANAAGTGFWAQVQGQAFAGVRAAAAAVANVPLYSTATAGALDDVAAASNLVRGVTFTTAAGGAGVHPALLNYPTIGTVADTDNNTP